MPGVLRLGTAVRRGGIPTGALRGVRRPFRDDVLLHNREQRIDPERLLEPRDRPQLGPERVLRLAGADHDDRHLRGVGIGELARTEIAAAHLARQYEVEQDQRERAGRALEVLERLLGVGRLPNAEPVQLEELRETQADVVAILDDENGAPAPRCWAWIDATADLGLDL